MVQFVKTHFPERQGTPPFRASRVVLLVRNPFDAIESFFNLMMTGKHTASLEPEVRAKTTKYFEEYVLKEIRVWRVFHEFWMNQDIPLLLIRYEDLIRKPDKVMERVLAFVLEVKRMGTFFNERIQRCISDHEEIERMGSYKPRSGGIGKSLAKYSPELFAKLKADEALTKVMKHLGYEWLIDQPAEEWQNLGFLEDYAVEYLPSWQGTEQKKVVVLNRGNLARGRNEVTPWQKIKMELGITGEGKKCDCEQCKARAKKHEQVGDGVKEAADTGTGERGEQQAANAEAGEGGEKAEAGEPAEKAEAGDSGTQECKVEAGESAEKAEAGESVEKAEAGDSPKQEVKAESGVQCVEAKAEKSVEPAVDEGDFGYAAEQG